MARNSYTVRIRMGAPHWDITAFAGDTIGGPRYVHIDLRKLDKTEQRKAMFEVTKYVRLKREAA